MKVFDFLKRKSISNTKSEADSNTRAERKFVDNDSIVKGKTIYILRMT